MVKPQGPALELPTWLQPLEQRASRHTTAMADGGRMVWHHWRADTSDHAPLVLLHGGSGSWTHWAHNIDALAASGRTLWVPDLPGFGDSDPPPQGCDAQAMVQPLADGLQQLLGAQECDLVGFSFGGLTGGLLAGAHPERVQRLVLVGAPAMGVVPRRQFQLRGWRHLKSEEARNAVHHHNLAELMLHDAALIDAPTLQLHVNNVLRDRLPQRRTSDTDALARALAQVTSPVHAIYGAHDALYKSWISHLDSAFAATGAPYRGLQLIADAGHWVQYEQPQTFNAALLRVLG